MAWLKNPGGSVGLGALVGIMVMVLAVTLGLQRNASQTPPANTLIFLTSADYAPFAYKHKNRIVGFEIDLARRIAFYMGKEAVFLDMPFHSLPAALKAGYGQIAIATITCLPQRARYFDFSQAYYFQHICFVTLKGALPQDKLPPLDTLVVACQLGTFLQTWLQSHHPKATPLLFDSGNQLVQAVKAQRAQGALMDGVQAKMFLQNEPLLHMYILETAPMGYAMMLNKDAPQTPVINRILQTISQNGELQALENTWLTPSSSPQP